MKPRYLVAVIALIATFGIGLAALIVRTSAQTNLNHAALIVRMKDGGIATRCVAFSESEITGYELLRRAQMPVIADVSNGGVSICKIGPASGCNYPAQKCFCECQDLNGTCIYWMYYYQDKGQWKYATLGAGAQKVKDGDINGWVYDVGTASGGTFPPVISYEQICNAAPAAQAITPTVTAVPASTAVSVVMTPTRTAQATATAVVSTPVSAASTTTVAATGTPLAAASATASLTPTATLTPAPTATLAPPSASATPAATNLTPTPAATNEQPSSNIIGYAVFGVIAVGLIATLLFTRRNSGKANQ